MKIQQFISFENPSNTRYNLTFRHNQHLLIYAISENEQTVPDTSWSRFGIEFGHFIKQSFHRKPAKINKNVCLCCVLLIIINKCADINGLSSFSSVCQYFLVVRERTCRQLKLKLLIIVGWKLLKCMKRKIVETGEAHD